MLHSSIIEFLFSVNTTVKMHICLVYSLTNFKFILLKLTKEGEFASCQQVDLFSTDCPGVFCTFCSSSVTLIVSHLHLLSEDWSEMWTGWQHSGPKHSIPHSLNFSSRLCSFFFVLETPPSKQQVKTQPLFPVPSALTHWVGQHWDLSTCLFGSDVSYFGVTVVCLSLFYFTEQVGDPGENHRSALQQQETEV